MREKQEERFRQKRKLNNDLIAIYRKFLDRSEPLSDAWCDCYNALQLELWIRFIQLIDDAKVPWQIKCRLLLQWYIDGIPDDLETAVYALGDFLAMKTENAEEDESITGSAPKQLYSFEQDAECIYSAFREVYGINLQTIPYMHWWEFQTLFAGLPEKTEIKQRIMYRSIDLRTIKDKDERKRIKKIQEVVALKKKNQRKMTDYEIGDMFA